MMPTSNASPREGDGDTRSRENDTTHPALEVVLGMSPEMRRKSSLIDTTGPSGGALAGSTSTKRTACYVHSLLEEQPGAPTTRNINGLVAQRQIDKTGDDAALGELTGGGAAAAAAATQSRLLTKEQLSDMAFGIRELAKRLAHVALRLDVRSVFLLTKPADAKLVGLARELAAWLLGRTEERYTVWVESTLEHDDRFDAAGLTAAAPSAEGRLRFWTAEFCAEKPQTFDIVLSLGGDGTVLYASHLFQRVVPPVLSFAMGSLGFLTKFDFDGYAATLTRAFAGGITISLRLRFEVTVMRSARRGDPADADRRDLVEELLGEESEDARTHRPDGSRNILNEVVLDRGPNPTMSSLEVFGDAEHFTTVQADGICVATPTGSTAYNLAAGGSLCHPDNPVILVTAICAHTLSFRPIILPDTIVLRVGVPYDARTPSWASFDGRERVELRPGDYVTISASRYPFPSVLPLERKGEDWIDSISRTLNWNSRQRQKAFEGEGRKE